MNTVNKGEASTSNEQYEKTSSSRSNNQRNGGCGSQGASRPVVRNQHRGAGAGSSSGRGRARTGVRAAPSGLRGSGSCRSCAAGTLRARPGILCPASARRVLRISVPALEASPPPSPSPSSLIGPCERTARVGNGPRLFVSARQACRIIPKLTLDGVADCACQPRPSNRQ